MCTSIVLHLHIAEFDFPTSVLEWICTSLQFATCYEDLALAVLPTLLASILSKSRESHERQWFPYIYLLRWEPSAPAVRSLLALTLGYTGSCICSGCEPPTWMCTTHVLIECTETFISRHICNLQVLYVPADGVLIAIDEVVCNALYNIWTSVTFADIAASDCLAPA